MVARERLVGLADVGRFRLSVLQFQANATYDDMVLSAEAVARMLFVRVVPPREWPEDWSSMVLDVWYAAAASRASEIAGRDATFERRQSQPPAPDVPRGDGCTAGCSCDRCYTAWSVERGSVDRISFCSERRQIRAYEDEQRRRWRAVEITAR